MCKFIVIISLRFLVKDRHTQFSPAQRSFLVMQILLRAKYDNNETKVIKNQLIQFFIYYLFA